MGLFEESTLSKIKRTGFLIDESLKTKYLMHDGIQPYNGNKYTDKELIDLIGGKCIVTYDSKTDYLEICLVTETSIIDVQTGKIVHSTKYMDESDEKFIELHNACKLMGENIEYQYENSDDPLEMVYPYTSVFKEKHIIFYKENTKITIDRNCINITGLPSVHEYQFTTIKDKGDGEVERKDSENTYVQSMTIQLPCIFKNMKNKYLHNLITKSKMYKL